MHTSLRPPFDSRRFCSTSCFTVTTTGCCILCSCTFWPVFWLEICSVVTVGSAAALALCSSATLYKNPSGQEGRRSAHASSRPKTRLGVRQNTVQRACNTPLLLLVCKSEGIEERLLGSRLAQRGPAVSSLQLCSTRSPHMICFIWAHTIERKVSTHNGKFKKAHADVHSSPNAPVNQ